MTSFNFKNVIWAPWNISIDWKSFSESKYNIFTYGVTFYDVTMTSLKLQNAICASRHISIDWKSFFDAEYDILSYDVTYHVVIMTSSKFEIAISTLGYISIDWKSFSDSEYNIFTHDGTRYDVIMTLSKFENLDYSDIYSDRPLIETFHLLKCMFFQVSISLKKNIWSWIISREFHIAEKKPNMLFGLWLVDYTCFPESATFPFWDLD